MIRERLQRLKELSRDELASFLAENLRSLLEDEALAVLQNSFITPAMVAKVAQSARLTALYSIRLRLVAHRHTPQASALKFIHYLYWPDLVRLSIEVTVPAPVRRAIDRLLVAKVEELSPGERVASARRCSHALVRALLFDADPRVFAALLVNQRVSEDDLVYYAHSHQARSEQLALLGADPKWSCRYSIRKALVLNPATPRSTAAAQLRFLKERDLRDVYLNPRTSTYLRKCVEKMRMESAAVQCARGSRVAGSRK